MNKDDFFEDLESYLEEAKNKSFPKALKVTILYVTGDKDVFEVSLKFWANMMIASKKRNQYLYHADRLINLNHVVKMQYEDLWLK